MDVVVDRVLRRLLRRLEQRPDVDVEADVGEGRGDHLGAAVVAVLAHLDHQHPRPPPLLLGEASRRPPGSRRSPRRPRRPRRRRRPASSPRRGAARTPSPSRPKSRPRVARARAASTAAASRLPPAARRRARARRAPPRRPPASRVARIRSSRATCASRTPDVVDVADVDRVLLRSSRYLLTPTITSSPRSTAACRRAALSSMRSFGMPEATALVMPPSASTSSISAQASLGQLRASGSRRSRSRPADRRRG